MHWLPSMLRSESSQNAAVTLGKTKYWLMARKTDAELQQRIQELKNNQEQALQVANNCRDEIMRIEAVLVDRAEAETEKKSIAK